MRQRAAAALRACVRACDAPPVAQQAARVHEAQPMRHARASEVRARVGVGPPAPSSALVRACTLARSSDVTLPRSVQTLIIDHGINQGPSRV
eukprot:COSAG02_NODE_4801_length_4960_cov_3.266406_2_plen_92_part_00